MALQQIEKKQATYQSVDTPELFNVLQPLLLELDMEVEDLQFLSELSPYLILDGHRTGVKDPNANAVHGYIEGAIFSLRLAKIMQRLGGRKMTFLIHTLRNYQTMDRMEAIFDAIGNIGEKFISQAYNSNIKLQYYGSGVHDNYMMSGIISKAEQVTENCNDFDLNYLTNYSEEWGIENMSEISDLPDINVIGRFTKGHYSGANIPGHTNLANFIYIQQASISENWSDEDMIVLILTLLKSYLSLKGFVGGKSYTPEEKNQIRVAREEEMWEGEYWVNRTKPYLSKRMVSFTPMGPITIKF